MARARLLCPYRIVLLVAAVVSGLILSGIKFYRTPITPGELPCELPGELPCV